MITRTKSSESIGQLDILGQKSPIFDKRRSVMPLEKDAIIEPCSSIHSKLYPLDLAVGRVQLKIALQKVELRGLIENLPDLAKDIVRSKSLLGINLENFRKDSGIPPAGFEIDAYLLSVAASRSNNPDLVESILNHPKCDDLSYAIIAGKHRVTAPAVTAICMSSKASMATLLTLTARDKLSSENIDHLIKNRIHNPYLIRSLLRQKSITTTQLIRIIDALAIENIHNDVLRYQDPSAEVLLSITEQKETSSNALAHIARHLLNLYDRGKYADGNVLVKVLENSQTSQETVVRVARRHSEISQFTTAILARTDLTDETLRDFICSGKYSRAFIVKVLQHKSFSFRVRHLRSYMLSKERATELKEIANIQSQIEASHEAYRKAYTDVLLKINALDSAHQHVSSLNKLEKIVETCGSLITINGGRKPSSFDNSEALELYKDVLIQAGAKKKLFLESKNPETADRLIELHPPTGLSSDERIIALSENADSATDEILAASALSATDETERALILLNPHARSKTLKAIAHKKVLFGGEYEALLNHPAADDSSLAALSRASHWLNPNDLITHPAAGWLTLYALAGNELTALDRWHMSRHPAADIMIRAKLSETSDSYDDLQAVQ